MSTEQIAYKLLSFTMIPGVCKWGKSIYNFWNKYDMQLKVQPNPMVMVLYKYSLKVLYLVMHV